MPGSNSKGRQAGSQWWQGWQTVPSLIRTRSPSAYHEANTSLEVVGMDLQRENHAWLTQWPSTTNRLGGWIREEQGMLLIVTWAVTVSRYISKYGLDQYSVVDWNLTELPGSGAWSPPGVSQQGCVPGVDTGAILGHAQNVTDTILGSWL